MIRIFLLVALGSCSLLFAEQAERDVPDPTDSLKINPLHGLPYINLALESDAFTELGITDKKPGDRFYFRIEGDSELAKVSFFGDNLAEYLTNVSPALDLMKAYRNRKMAHMGMLCGGALVTLVGTIFSVSDKNLSPVLFVGIGIASLSWIPNYFSKTKIPEAVGLYNKAVERNQPPPQEDDSN